MASNYNLKRSDLPKYVKWPDLKGFMQGLPGSGLSEVVTHLDCCVDISINSKIEL